MQIKCAQYFNQTSLINDSVHFHGRSNPYNNGQSKYKKNKLGLSWGSTRLRQLAWSYPTKLNIVFIKVFNIGLNIELNIGLNIGLYIGFNIGVQYWV